MWKWLKYLLLLGGIVAGIIIWIRYSSCRRKGEESGIPYSCPLFSSNPVWLTIQKIFYAMNEGKCYEVTDYNKGMSYRQVGLSQCGESEVKKSSGVEEAIYEEKII